MKLWMERVFTQQPQSGLISCRRISAAMKSLSQARSTTVRRPALQLFIKDTFPLLRGVHQPPRPESRSSKVSLGRGWSIGKMEIFLGELIVFGVASGCNYNKTSFENHAALVWFGQTYEMKLEHDEWGPCSWQSSTNKIIFSQICFCLFFSFTARRSINTGT